MKTLSELRLENELTHVREARASMRACALEYRRAIHPGAFHNDFNERVHHALFYLGLAFSYRKNARNYAQMAAS